MVAVDSSTWSPSFHINYSFSVSSVLLNVKSSDSCLPMLILKARFEPTSETNFVLVSVVCVASLCLLSLLTSGEGHGGCPPCWVLWCDVVAVNVTVATVLQRWLI